ncbi:hypothetical protein AAG587_17740 [Vreelandella neptunia]|uniref:hypothetical protein n=1 Tax=Vreelandella neptunia TaxID=115551 RepID=UPI00315A3090
MKGIRYWPPPRPSGGKVTNHCRVRLGGLAGATSEKQAADSSGFEAAENPLNAALQLGYNG